MKRITLYIIAVNECGELLSYNKNFIGSKLSTPDKLYLNEVTNRDGINEFTIVFNELTLANDIDLHTLAEYILSIEPKYNTGANEKVVITINYLYNRNDKINPYVVNTIKELNRILKDEVRSIDTPGKCYIGLGGKKYKSGEIDVDSIADSLSDLIEETDRVSDYEERDEYKEDITVNIDDPFSNVIVVDENKLYDNADEETTDAVRRVADRLVNESYEPQVYYYNSGNTGLTPIRATNENPNYDEFEGHSIDVSSKNKKRKKHKKGSSLFTKPVKSSKSFKKSVNTKKNIKNYNMLFVKNKDALIDDYETIMKFLKKFIPGDSKWIIKYRKEVASRWIYSLVRTRKQVKQLEEERNIKYKQDRDKKFTKGIKAITKATMSVLK